MKMLAVVVTVRMPIPPTLPRLPVMILFGIMHVEIIRHKPANTKICTLHTRREISHIKLSHYSIRCIRRVMINIGEASTLLQPPTNPL
ncbi:hypothetical protein SAMN04487948_13411 [Halogranum amylolyticum]|uniref:Uncharacterized protein n=1 Tax=Halogranum amylolyticum TaxID=660520 RepID=A0A1H8WM71_9EURY|nr:hypothetical protein SAMN04487948_13411 [Halogranum amylolyticum]